MGYVGLMPPDIMALFDWVATYLESASLQVRRAEYDASLHSLSRAVELCEQYPEQALYRGSEDERTVIGFVRQYLENLRMDDRHARRIANLAHRLNVIDRSDLEARRG